MVDPQNIEGHLNVCKRGLFDCRTCLDLLYRVDKNSTEAQREERRHAFRTFNQRQASKARSV